MHARPKTSLLATTLISLCAATVAPADGLPELWSVRRGSYMDSCAALDSSGTVYITVSGNLRFSDIAGGKLVAIASNGVEKWIFTSHAEIRSSPAVGTDKTIYFGARDRNLYAIAPDGTLKWSFTTGAWVDSSPAIAPDGTICFGSWDRNFYALNPDGSKKWSFATGGPVDSSPAIGADGTIYFGSHDKLFYALKPDGSKKWTFATEGAVISSPALDADGTIYFSSTDGRLYALNPDGTKKWQLWTGGVRASSPIIDAHGNICLGVNNEFFSASRDGKKNWSFGYPVVEGSGAAAADGTVYFGGDTGILYCFGPDGMLKTSTTVEGSVTGSPAISADGTTYIASTGAPFRALKGNSGLAKSPWPKFRGNPANTGRVNAP